MLFVKAVRYLLLVTLCVLSVTSQVHAEEAYQPNWNSLKKHNPAPEWFRDAKFGIYFHWGVYSVPAFSNEWYPQGMHYKPNGHVYKHHAKTYGEPTEFGYEKFVPMFKAEYFDAEEWVSLFEKAGAKFIGPVAEHHDGFAMWDSKVTPWNSVDRGPRKDIMGDIATAARQRGMKVVATFHHARNNLWEKTDKDGKKHWTGHYLPAKQNFPSVLEDKERAFLYGYIPRDQFLKMWGDKLDEVITQYSPDLIWFDSWLHEIPEQERMQFLANYFNHAQKTGQEVVVTYKQEDMPQNICVIDIEKGSMNGKTEFTWLADDTISLGSWCYTENLRVKSTEIVLHSLLDIVSKNGQLILNVSPKADGTIPQNQRKVLLELGVWLGKYGECIYGTRPFVLYGHGPTVAGKGHFGGVATDKAKAARDVRYTRKGSTVYAIQLGVPKAGAKTLFRGFAIKNSIGPFKIQSVSLLGSTEKIEWKLDSKGVTVTAPAKSPDSMANVYKIVVVGAGK